MVDTPLDINLHLCAVGFKLGESRREGTHGWHLRMTIRSL